LDIFLRNGNSGSEKSDLFDVLAYVAYALPPLNREERAARARIVISSATFVQPRHFSHPPKSSQSSAVKFQ
jgi:hypothetical protein